jgi:hypothetical protein
MPDSLPSDLLAQRLPDWYKAVSIDLSGELVAQRKETIEKLAKDLAVDQTASAVAYAHGKKKNGDGLIEWIRETARKQDPGFAADASDLEPQVMIAAAIAHHLVTWPEHQSSTVLSLLIESARFRGFSSVIRSQKLSRLAANQLRVAGESSRALPSRNSASVRAAVKKAFNALADFPDDPNPVTNAQMMPWAKATQDAFSPIAKRLDELEQKVGKGNTVTREQLDQTTWLLEEFCELAGAPWADIHAEKVPLFAAAELAAYSPLAAAPSASVMLASTILKAGSDPKAPIDVMKAVQRAATALDSWEVVTQGDLLPVSVAISTCRELGPRSSWRDTAKKRRGGGNLPAVNTQDLAEQALREITILRLLGEDDE